MPYYHVLIVKKSGGTRRVFAFDLSMKEVQERIISPLTQWKPFICGNAPIEPSNVDHIRINETEESSAAILARSKKMRIARKILGRLAEDSEAGYVDEYSVIHSGRVVTGELIKGLHLSDKGSRVFEKKEDEIPEKQKTECMPMEYEKFRRKIVDLESDLGLFRVEFLDRDGFTRFADNLLSEVSGYNEFCITGYFSETIRKAFEEITKLQNHKLRLICQEFNVSNNREKKNLEVLKKLSKAGVEIKVNNRLHARFFVAYNSVQEKIRGFLIIGSFDFNTECIGKERYDAGIKTANPDLVNSAKTLFEEIWADTESSFLNEKYP
jgi:hypothetical protein